jgi:hypothetical protein
VYRVIVFYEEAPPADSYAEHVELCKQVPGGAFRYGPVTGSPMGEPKHAFYAEWDFPDKAAFDAAVRSDEFMASGKDAYKRGFPNPTVEFVELS